MEIKELIASQIDLMREYSEFRYAGNTEKLKDSLENCEKMETYLSQDLSDSALLGITTMLNSTIELSYMKTSSLDMKKCVDLYDRRATKAKIRLEKMRRDKLQSQSTR